MKKISAIILTLILLFTTLPLTVMAASDDNTAVSVPDASLKQALISKGVDTNKDGIISRGELRAVTGELDLNESGISDITGLEYLTGVSILDLSGNRISDITALAGLTHLVSLNLSDNMISDISPLSNLKLLVVLNIDLNMISNINWLSMLSNLTYLDASYNQISDASVLSNFFDLNYLNVAGNQISDISSVKLITGLTYLDISYNRIADISALDHLWDIEYLDASHNQISDITPLMNLSINQVSQNPLKIVLSNNFIDISSGSAGMSVIDSFTNKGWDISYDNQTSSEFNFPDLDSVSWARDAIISLAKDGIINGYNDGTFKPGNYITRAEFTKLLVATFNIYDPAATTKFTDVSSNEWYCSYVASAEKAGLAKGSGDGLFNPTATITRQEMFIFCARAIDLYKGYPTLQTGDAEIANQLGTFTDGSNVSDWASQYVATITQCGLVTGSPDGSGKALYPKNPITRAEVAVVLSRTMQLPAQQ